MPIETKIELKYTPHDLKLRINNLPREMGQDIDNFAGTMVKLILIESVPAYPARPVTITNYRRTGTLGRSLTAQGDPNMIYEVKAPGLRERQVRFGTNVDYAKYVIGETTQAWMHRMVWWKISAVGFRAQTKLKREWNKIVEKWANYIGGT